MATKKAAPAHGRGGRTLRRSTNSRHVLQPLDEFVQLALGLVLGVAVALLELAGQLVAPAGDGGQVVVGKLAPLLLDLARELLPVPRHPIPVHHVPPPVGKQTRTPGAAAGETRNAGPFRRTMPPQNGLVLGGCPYGRR